MANKFVKIMYKNPVFRLGLVFAPLLGFKSGKFSMRTGGNIIKIHGALPNVDCGACGYATCLAFARAVAEGKALPTGCVPGGPAVAHAIGDILGVPITMADPLMAVVHCKGGTKEATQRFVYEGIADCHAAIIAQNGPKTCRDGCLGLGSCVSACPFNAIAISDNKIAVVNPDACTGCGMCVKACPRAIIELIPRVHKIFLACVNHDRGSRVKNYCTMGCTACTQCVKATLSGAITMENSLPVLDYASGENFIVAAHTCPSDCFMDLVKFRPKVNIDAKCDGCGECVSSCPTAAITGEKGKRHVVNKEKCIGCGLCLNTCPVHAIAMWGGLGYVEDSRRRVTRS
jgi:RnfABCDGE-type electron transport complex B subunit